jgi:hypothetical protein
MAQAIGIAQTGYVVDATEGTYTTLTSAHFINDSSFETLNIQIAKEDLRNVGRNGITQRVNGQEVSTIPNGTVPSFGKQDIPFLLAAGFTSASANTFILYAPASTGANASRTSVQTLSIAQYDGKYQYSLSAAKPTNMSLGVTNGRQLGWTVGLQGRGAMVANSTMIKQTPITSASPTVLKNAPLSVSGISVPYSEVTLDLGLTYEQGTGDASTSTGHRLLGEITSYDPKLSLSIYTDDVTLSLFQSYINCTSAAVSWAYGSGTGNVYTWTFTGYIDTMTPSMDGNLRNNQYVISPIAKADGELIKVVIS